MNPRTHLPLAFALSVAFSLGGAHAAPETAMETRVLKWKDGKQAVFLIAFDDSCVSHVANAIPALTQHGFPGTFYINPGNGPFKARQKDWEQEIPGKPGIEYGNHTFWHKGATNAVQLDVELAKCAEVIDACFPNRKQPRLVSFGRPGGVPWTVTKEEQAAALAKYHLVERPPFWGAAIHVKTAADMEALVDKAIAKGEMGHLDFHGVGGDWLAADMAFFNAFLAKLDACRDTLWVADHVAYHKYLTERTSAKVVTVASGEAAIRLNLTSDADPALYDQPLTLETTVPASWQACTVTQAGNVQRATVRDGTLRYEALPGAGEITLAPARP